MEVLLYEKLPEERVRCNTCQWRCAINTGKLGVCRTRRNDNGVLTALNYAQVTSMAADPVEKKPLNHFFPGTSVFSLGTWGCNFRCTHCQNWQISCADQVDLVVDTRELVPAEAVKLALKTGCRGMAWTYNEPTVWFEYTLDCARLARQANLYTVYVTNGYITMEALDTIGPFLDAWRVDVKGFSDKAYRELAGISGWRAILDMVRRAREKWGMHVEVVTNVIPGVNDDELQLKAIAGWICEELGELTPWHITRFYPHHRMSQPAPTPVATLERANEMGREAGLRFVYLGNVSGNDREDTVCYSCGSVAIQRIGYNTRVIGVNGSCCAHCGAELNIRA